MNVKVRGYRHEDAEQARAIWNHVVEYDVAFPQEEGLAPEEADAFFSSQSYTGVAEDADTGKVVGIYILHPNNIGHCGHLCNASYAVASGVRGQHIGEKLVLDCIEQGPKHGFRILQFNAVVASNVHAIHLYERLGFVRLGTIPEGYRKNDGSYVDIIAFYKVLPEA